MATDKVMITISGLQDHEVILASERHPDKTLHQVDLFQAADAAPTVPARSEAQSITLTATVPPEAAGAAVGGKSHGSAPAVSRPPLTSART